MDIEKSIFEVIKNNLFIEEITETNIPLMDLPNADSLTHVIIIREIEEELSIEFSFDELMEIELLSDLIEISKKKVIK
tara:strand:- start:12966 stop:13199 length:234 start_codon:yes stop_codon:yes gene_type:complete